jgi:O-antigen/teichoic acid export membrane protein
MSSSFAKTTVSGAMWVYAAFYAGKLIVFLSTVVLARILTKNEYGLVGYAVTFISFLDVVRDLGIGAALIHHREELTAKSTAFWLSLVVGTGIFVFVWFAAPLLGVFFRDDSIVWVLRVLAFNYPLWALGGTHEALLIKELAFHRKFIPDFSQAITKGLISIGLAVIGFGPWSLIIGHLAGTAAAVFAFWSIVPWRPKFEFVSNAARSLLHFGLPMVAVNILGAIVLNADYVIIGRYLGKAQLGIYTTAFRIPELVVLQFCAIVAQVLFPVFSKMRDDEDALVGAFLQTARYVALITVPLGLGMALLARPFILAVFTDKWLEAIPVMQAISIYALVLSLGYNAGDVYKALGVPGVLTKISFVKAIILIPGLLWAVMNSGNLVAVAFIQIIVAFVGSIINFTVALRMLKISARTLLHSLSPALLAGTGLVITVLLFGMFTISFNPWIQVLIGVLTGGLAYAAILWWRERELLVSSVQLFGSVLLKR